MMPVISRQPTDTSVVPRPHDGTSHEYSLLPTIDRIANRIAERLLLPLGNLFWGALILLYAAVVLGIIS